MTAIPGPSAEQEVEHLAEQCATLLRENERLYAFVQWVGVHSNDPQIVQRARAELRGVKPKEG